MEGVDLNKTGLSKYLKIKVLLLNNLKTFISKALLLNKKKTKSTKLLLMKILK